ncbi:amino acid ABC transporter permease [Oryzicola mucosus]|uniref:Amino acid ABC transporter permease n=1 Tax=Oryzicola mucosus TaxID=2767425 RepID=A0A8J6Q471_9HYPH|nr:amino acid ABC transporter permease [Oryzicola mucosus]MBD0415745.1 amino acid ABC transporter permease [Oryzicola mucosus]
MASVNAIKDDGDRTSLIYNPVVRGIVFQCVVFFGILALIYWFVQNTLDNLARAGRNISFGFLNERAGFDIGQALIPYSSDSTYTDALQVGLLNTLLVAAVGIVTATLVGFIVGIGRLSRNWLIRKICTVYVEVFRNIPPLLVIFFWYLGVLAILPQPRDSINLPFGSLLSNRGLSIPRPVWGEGAWLVGLAFVIAIAMAIFVARRASARQMATGQRLPVLWINLGLFVGLILLAMVVTGFPLSFDVPVLGAFQTSGGFAIGPEFLALYLSLSLYTASFIAEIVRAGIRGVGRGQSEAAHALGIRSGTTTRLVVIPQAMRIIVPPLTSQYLNLTKNSSLAIAVGYPDLVSVGGTILNKSGNSIQIVAIWMVVYLTISLLTSVFMNWFNTRVALVER